MDKNFLLTYTDFGSDGLRHSYHAWFQTEEELHAFVKAGSTIEEDLAIEILSCRILNHPNKKLFCRQ